MSVLHRSILLSSADRYFALVLMVATTAIMARLLTPAETGLFLLAQSIVLLGENFRDFGASSCIIQAKEVTPQFVRSAFTIVLSLSVLAGSALALLSGPLAEFYDAPELRSLLLISALGFLVAPFGMPNMAVMRRALAFEHVAAANIISSLTCFVATVGMGLAGFGASSYIVGSLAGCIALTLAALVLRFEPWMYRPSLAEARSILSFGGISVATSVANLAYEMLPRLALSRILGLDAVGLFSRATGVVQLPDRLISSALYPVVLPAMSERARSNGDLRPAYLRGLELVSVLHWPALIMIALLADPLVRLLLGSQWLEVVPLVRIIAFAYLALAPALLTYPTLVAVGRVRDTLTMSLISLPPSAVLLVGLAHWGIGAIALGMLAILPMQMGVALCFIRRAIGISWGDVVLALTPSAAVSAGTVAIPVLVILSSPTAASLDLWRTVAAVVGAAFGWLISVSASRHPIWSEVVTVQRMILARTKRRLPPVA